MRSRVATWIGLWLWLGALGGPAAGAQERQINDPFYWSKGAWGQAYGDQWALKRVGFTPPGQGRSAWDLETGASRPVVVAVIDTGLDYFHPDLRRENVWRNPKEELNGRDDDGNGYIDDLIGWNFIDNDNNPWDYAGHGTHVAGIIAAAMGNGEGIAGINRGARIMPLKVLNFVGRGRSVGIAGAIFYAVKNGARVINLSLGGEHLSKTEQLAINYAAKRGVVVVVAAGNEATDTRDYGPAGLPKVITVGATDVEDKRVGFSNWGAAVNVAAPGVDILSLRARRTDFVLVSGARDYQAGSAFVGPAARYYRASGTSFAAPFVAGVASLLFAKNPKLTGEQVTRMILQSARDIEVPGKDQYTGYGLLDARAALAADPAFFIEARLTRVQPAQEGGQTVVRVSGTADANAFAKAWIEVGPGKHPTKWKQVSRTLTRPVKGGTLDDLAAGHFRGAKQWVLRLITEHKNGKRREARFQLNLQ
ncbi:MAG: S8 family peptidase [Candidatus Methylomirabilales bacterium]